MKLAAKFTLMLMVAVLALIAVDGYLVMRQEIRMLDEDLVQDAILFRERIEPIIRQLWEDGGDAKVSKFLQEMNQGVDAEEFSNLELTSIKWVTLSPNSADENRPIAPLDQLAPETFGDFKTIRLVSNDQMLIYSKLAIANDRAIEFAEPITYSKEMYVRFGRRVLILTLLTLLLGVGTVVFLGRELIGNPLRKLIDKTRRIGQGDLTGPVKVSRRDEFGELARSLNSMCDQLATAQQQVERETRARLEAMDQLRHADRLRTVGRLAAGIAHEIGTPLNVVSGRAEMIAAGNLSREDVTKNALIIKSESERIASIIRNVLNFARQTTPNREPVDLSGLIDRVVDIMRPLSEKKQTILDSEIPSTPLMANVDRSQIQQALINLIVNGMQAMPQGGTVKIRIATSSKQPPRSEEVESGEFICISVEDQGHGIEPEVLDSIFEPFFTTKDVGEGTGLGLSIVHGIVKEHGGWIEVTSEIDQGTRFDVYLPQEGTK